MKFTEQLKFNSVPEWKDYYMNYSQLKGIIDNICRIESRAATSASVEDEEQHLLGGTTEEAQQEFIKALDKELAKCIAFFFRKESELHGKYESVFLDVHGCEGLLVTSPEPMSGPEIEEAKRQQRIAFWQRSDNDLQRETLKQKMQDLFVQLNGLFEYLELNYAGFRKIVKKHDKLTSNNLKEVYQPILNAKLPMSAKPQLRDMIKSLEAEYSIVCRDGEVQRAKLELAKQLKDKVRPLARPAATCTAACYSDAYACISHMHTALTAAVAPQHQPRMAPPLLLCATRPPRSPTPIRQAPQRPHSPPPPAHTPQVKFDRSTVWRDMVALERRSAAAHVQSASTPAKDLWMARYRSSISLVTALAVFVALLNYPIFEEEQKQNCLALLALVSILWCTEALPLFVTSMMVPLLAVTLRVMMDNSTSPPTRLKPQQAAPLVFHAMFSQVGVVQGGWLCCCLAGTCWYALIGGPLSA
jgi:hypothetical protein